MLLDKICRGGVWSKRSSEVWSLEVSVVKGSGMEAAHERIIRFNCSCQNQLTLELQKLNLDPDPDPFELDASKKANPRFYSSAESSYGFGA